MKNIFFKQVANEVKKIMKDYKVSLSEVPKPGNIIMHGITISERTKTEHSISTTIYIDDYFDLYIGNKITINEISCKVINNWEEANSLKTSFDLDKLRSPDNIYLKVINKNFSSEYIKDTVTFEIPNTNFVILPYIRFNDFNSIGIASTVFNKKLLEFLNMGKDEVLKYAIENSKRDFEIIVSNLELYVLSELGYVNVENKIPNEPTLTIITNKEKKYGASVIFYTDVLKDISNVWNTDLIILPSSVHDVIVLPYLDEEMTSQGFQNMLSEVNLSELSPEDRLDNIPYIYRRDNNSIKMY